MFLRHFFRTVIIAISLKKTPKHYLSLERKFDKLNIDYLKIDTGPTRSKLIGFKFGYVFFGSPSRKGDFLTSNIAGIIELLTMTCTSLDVIPVIISDIHFFKDQSTTRVENS